MSRVRTVRGRRLGTLGAGLAIALRVSTGHAEDRPLRDGVRLRADTLTVRLVDAPLADVLQELSRQADAEIRGQLIDARAVTATFEDVPLAQALARLLPEQNFALVYGSGGRLMAVQLLGGAHPITVVPAAVRRPPWQEALFGVIAHHPAVPVTGPLADALGAETVTLPQLLEAGLHHEDAAVRGEAIRVGLQTVQDDPELRAAIIRHLEPVDNEALATVLRAASGYSEDVAREALDASQAPELRLKASSVLQRLRADAPQ